IVYSLRGGGASGTDDGSGGAGGDGVGSRGRDADDGGAEARGGFCGCVCGECGKVFESSVNPFQGNSFRAIIDGTATRLHASTEANSGAKSTSPSVASIWGKRQNPYPKIANNAILE